MSATQEVSKWAVGAGIVVLALFPLSIPILVLTAAALVPLAVPLLALGLLAAVVIAPALLVLAIRRRLRGGAGARGVTIPAHQS